MSYHVLAFFMGLFGSLHCVAMCGPLMLAFTGGGPAAAWRTAINKIVYQAGRVAMYTLLGLGMGTVGHLFDMKGWQQVLTYVCGIALTGVGLFALFGKRIHRIARLQQRAVAPLTRWIARWMYRPGGHIAVGMLNGLLPCGMVYMALAAALNADTVMGGGLFMLWFGMGTWPAMLAASLFGNFLSRRVRINFAAWLPLLALLMGVWFLLRGANLDIPFLSPLIYPEGATVCRQLQ